MLRTSEDGMDLYVIRHADAGNPAEWHGPDPERPLSDLGRRQARALGAALRAQGISLGAVVSSPYLRARETAEGLVSDDGPTLSFSELLASGMMRRRKLSRFLAGLGLASLAIVGHDPDLPEYLGWILAVDPDKVRLAKGGAALVRFDKEPAKGDGELVWSVTPDWYTHAEANGR
jgi:phosphohistidine phosphatase